MDNVIAVKNKKADNLIYTIRGRQVMLDSDLAILYNCSNGTKTINQAVKRNLERFPKRFRFQITMKEYKEILKSQTGTLELKQGQYSKYFPYVYTEQGVAMLAAVLKTDVAAQVSIRIMDAFVYMREQLKNDDNLNYKINNVETRIIHFENKIKDLDDRVDLLFDKFKTKNNYLFFEGEYYDSYSILIDILNSSKKEIIIIDNYIDKYILDVISKTKKEILIITNKYNNEDIYNYKKQYKNLKIIKTNCFHDRFIIIDRKVLYHSGSSFKDLGKKSFAINIIKEKKWLDELLKTINSTKR